MSVPDGEGFGKIDKAINKYSGYGSISMVYADLYETIKSDDHRNIEPGNYLMYIGRDDNLNSYKLIVIKNGTKYYCSIYDILKTSLVEDL